jgi:hypothetical protein
MSSLALKGLEWLTVADRDLREQLDEVLALRLSLDDQDALIENLNPNSAISSSQVSIVGKLYDECREAVAGVGLPFTRSDDPDVLRPQIRYVRGKLEYKIRQLERKIEEVAPATPFLAPLATNTTSADPRKVFVVVGRNIAANSALSHFLRSVDLDPLEWSEAVAMTGTGSPYPGEVLEVAMSRCQAVLVFLTGDDMARLGTRYLKNSDQPYEADLTPQCRANVIFEAGMAFGRYPNRTIIVALGYTRPFSDTLGRHIVFLSNTAQSRHDLTGRLKTAGCAVKTEHRNSWLTDGDFEGANLPPDNSPKEDLGNAKPTGPLQTSVPARANLGVKKPFAWDATIQQIVFAIPDHLSIEVYNHTDEKTGATGVLAYMVNASPEWLNSFDIEVVDAKNWSETHQKFLQNRNFGRISFNKVETSGPRTRAVASG